MVYCIVNNCIVVKWLSSVNTDVESNILEQTPTALLHTSFGPCLILDAFFVRNNRFHIVAAIPAENGVVVM